MSSAPLGQREADPREADSREAGPVIVGAEIGAGHDGNAELVLTLRFGPGSDTRVTLDTDAGMRLMRSCGARDIADLPGHSWHKVLEAGPDGD